MGQVLILREVPRAGVRLSAGLTAAETTAALAIAHTAAGGALPSTGWLLAIAATVYGASLTVLRGRLPIRIVLPALVGLQLLLHAWLVTLTAGAELHAHAHANGSGALLGLTWPMVLAHVGAGLVAGAAWLLRRRAVDILIGWQEHRLPAVALRHRAFRAARAGIGPGRDVTLLPTRGPPDLRFVIA